MTPTMAGPGGSQHAPRAALCLSRGLQGVHVTLAARLGEAEEKIKVLHSGMTLAWVAALKWLGAVWGSGEGVASETVNLGT